MVWAMRKHNAYDQINENKDQEEVRYADPYYSAGQD